MAVSYIYGRHPVKALIAIAPERVIALHVTSTVEHEFRSIAAPRAIKEHQMDERKFDKELQNAVHQGVIAEVNTGGLMLDFKKFMEGLTVTSSTCLVLLNEVTDPHNVGAIIRSAAAFGAAGVLLPSHGGALVTGTVAKASAGTIFSIPLVMINNENHTILDLKKHGFWSYGLSGDAKKAYSSERFDAPAVFVVGSEGDGLRTKTQEHCDILLSIPMHARVESLNASVSAAVVLSEWSKQHPEAVR